VLLFLRDVLLLSCCGGYSTFHCSRIRIIYLVIIGTAYYGKKKFDSEGEDISFESSILKNIRTKVSPFSLSEKNKNARKFAIPTT
jgi:hypothetical protein